MPLLTVGTAQVSVPANPQRTAILLQNISPVNTIDIYLVSQDNGVRLYANGGNFELLKTDGWEVEKEIFAIGSGAGSLLRYIEGFGVPQAVTISTTPQEPNPQDPTANIRSRIFDAPNMQRITRGR